MLGNAFMLDSYCKEANANSVLKMHVSKSGGFDKDCSVKRIKPLLKQWTSSRGAETYGNMGTCPNHILEKKP